MRSGAALLSGGADCIASANRAGTTCSKNSATLTCSGIVPPYIAWALSADARIVPCSSLLCAVAITRSDGTTYGTLIAIDRLEDLPCELVACVEVVRFDAGYPFFVAPLQTHGRASWRGRV